METEIKTYIQTVRQICPDIADKEIDYLINKLSVHHFEPKHYYIEPDKVQKSSGYVVSGLLRAFYIDDKGKDITVRFVNENQFAIDYASFLRKEKSKYYFQCLEKCTIISLPLEHSQNDCSQYPGLERYAKLIGEETIKNQQRRIDSFQFYSAQERYLDFVKNFPDLFNRVSLSHLSSYLGIERPSLSRIRKNLLKK